MNDSMIFSGASPALLHLATTALRHSPWLSCDGQSLAIDWRRFINSLDRKDRPHVNAIPSLVAILEGLLPRLPLDTFDLAHMDQSYPPYRRDEPNENSFSCIGPASNHPLDDAMQKAKTAVLAAAKETHQALAMSSRPLQ